MDGAMMVVATVPVSDLERARTFYGETLGLTFLWENPASIRFRCTEGPLRTQGHIARLGPARVAWFRDPDGNFLGLRQG